MVFDFFGSKKKVIIGMAHIGAMPGSPLYDEKGGMQKLIDGVAADIERLQAGGVDAIMFGNENDRPYAGEHQRLIDQRTWDRVHSILQQSPRLRAANTRSETPALLKGLLYGEDGAAFSPTHTRKGDRLYRYYVSQTVLKYGAGTCPVPRVPAAEIEAAVIDQLRAMLRAPEVVVATWKAARVETEEVSEAEVREALIALDPLWVQLFPAEQARVIQLLIERVEVGTSGLRIHIRDSGLTQMVTEVGTVTAKNRKEAA
jgi:hypothetical protein